MLLAVRGERRGSGYQVVNGVCRTRCCGWPFLQSGNEIRTIICTTNAIESINARLPRAVKARGHFPSGQAALKCLYLTLLNLDPGGKGRKRWSNRWKAALNAFDITFDGRLSAGRK